MKTAGRADEDHVVLVNSAGDDLKDGSGNSLTMPKLAAHRQGKLHRAISVFVFSSRGELLLQKRAKTKYHSAGLWSNTCCSHPRPGETPLQAAGRRLRQEMNIACPLQELLTFTYYADVGNGLTEHEFDHVFTGFTDQAPTPDPGEAEDWQWQNIEALQKDLFMQPESYTFWLKQCYRDVIEAVQRLPGQTSGQKR